VSIMFHEDGRLRVEACLSDV